MEVQLKEHVSAIVERLYQQKIPSEQILVNIPPKEHACDFTVVIFPIAKLAKKSPDQAAKEIGEELKGAVPEISSYDVVKGFLNLKLKDEFWIQFFLEKSAYENFGILPSTGKKVM